MATAANPVVSVIVPARNEEVCLAACLESLVAQTGIDFEIIVVDDASTDRTAEIARSFEDCAWVGSASSSAFVTDGKGTTSSRADEYSTSSLRADSLANRSAKPERDGGTGGTAKGRALPVRTDPNASKNCRTVIVISAPPLPENWTGKNNAMSAGATIAKGKWLLFTDADTVHKPGSLARAVAEAEEHGAALLSYSPEQEVRTFWEKAVMPVIFAELAAVYPPKKVNDPASPIAAANGQYLMISREAYDTVGGHAAIANNLLEDVAMARLVKTSGHKIFFRYGGDAVRTRMYRSWSQMKEGWTKNLALLFRQPRALAFARGMEFAFIFGNLLAGILCLVLKQIEAASVVLLLSFLVAARVWMRVRRAHFPQTSNLLALGGLAIFSYLLLRSDTFHKKRRVTWKGRNYGNASARTSI